MFRLPRVWLTHRTPVVLASAFLVLAFASPVSAATPPFQLITQSAIYNPGTGEVTFRVVFNQTPSFFVTDSVGRQADSFQYFVLGDSNQPYPANYDAIIRGEEIHSTPDHLIPVRNAVPPDLSDPSSGGWGTIRGEAPYTLTSGSTMTFSAPLSLISNRTGVMNISYRLETYTYGSLTGFVDGSIVVLTTKGQCKKGGWRNLQFKNQGDCVSFVATRKNQPG